MSEARLLVTDSQGHRMVPLDRPTLLIGRGGSVDLRFAVTDVSREHAEIVREEGRFVMRDRASRFGTFVNGDRITERILQHGDRIRLGKSEAIELVFTTADTHTTPLLDAVSHSGDLLQMAAILDGLRALGSGRVLDEVLALVLDLALDVTKAERGFVMLANRAGGLDLKIARGRGKTTLPGTSFRTSEKIPREVFATGESRIVPDLLAEDFKGDHLQTIADGIRLVLCVPLQVTPMKVVPTAADARHIIGVLYLDGTERSTMTAASARSSLELFASQAAMAIDSARLYAESAEKDRIDRDLRVAADIQRALLPEPCYEDASFDLAAESLPCRTVGGDFFDYLAIGDRAFGFALGMSPERVRRRRCWRQPCRATFPRRRACATILPRR